MAAYGWITRKFIRYGEVITEHLAASSVTSAKLASGAVGATAIASGSIAGSKLANVATATGAGTPTAVTPGVASVVSLSITDAASAVYDFTMPFKCKVIDVYIVQVGAGNAGNAVVVKNAAGTAISSSMNNAADKAVTRTTSIDSVNNTIAASAVLKVDVTRVAGANVLVYATIIPIA
jgi:type III secretory pathway component EscS